MPKRKLIRRSSLTRIVFKLSKTKKKKKRNVLPRRSSQNAQFDYGDPMNKERNKSEIKLHLPRLNNSVDISDSNYSLINSSGTFKPKKGEISHKILKSIKHPKSRLSSSQKQNKDKEVKWLSLHYSGPPVWEAAVLKRQRDKLPKNHLNQETMKQFREKITKQNLYLKKKLHPDYNEKFDDFTTKEMEDRNVTVYDKKNTYDFQRPPYFERLQKNPDLRFTSAYDQEEDGKKYNEEDLEGIDALDNYGYKYNKMYTLEQKVAEEEKDKKEAEKKKSPLLDFLLEVDKEKKVPKGLGLVNRKSSNTEVKAGNFLFGDRYARSFSFGIKQRVKLETLNLDANRLSDLGFLEILSRAPKTLLVLDISNNPTLTIETYKRIADYLDVENPKLRQLIMEGNSTGDKPILLLCEAIKYHQHLKYWNISKNNLTNTSAFKVAEVITENKILNVLFMHWNKIREEGGLAIATSIQDSESLQIFDISFNNIGTLGREHSVAKALSKTFKLNYSLIHVDISNCNLDSKDIEIINQGLTDNHCILGIHMLGNMGKTDALGFLHKTDDIDFALATLYTRIKPNLKRGHKHNSQAISLQASSNCWICEGWTEVKFEFDPDLVFSEKHDQYVPIYLQLSSDEFDKDLLLPDPEQPGIYFSTRMVPPGKVSYYFTKENLNYVSQNQPIGKLNRTTELFMDVPETNILENIMISNSPITETLIESMSCIPRPPPKVLPGREKLKTPWDFFKSVFREYKRDTPALLNKCFEFDWEMCKIPRIIKNPDELKLIRNYLKKNYKHMRELYKYYSSVSPMGNIFCIGNNTFNDIISHFDGIIDNQTLKLADIDLEFVSTNAGPKKSNPRNPERSLVRFQMMEIFTRIGLTKFFKTKESPTQVEAVERMFINYILPFTSKFDSNKWRMEQLWNEKCDYVYKRYLIQVKTVYEKHSGRFAMPSATRYMSFEEFFDLICLSGVVDDTFGQREIGICYNLSMMTQRDEIDKDKHLNMVLVEFIEAIGRVADKLSLPPPFENMDGVPEGIGENKGDLTGSSRRENYSSLPLHVKIETFIVQLVRATHKNDYFQKLCEKMSKFHHSQAVAKKKMKFAVVEQPYRAKNKIPKNMKVIVKEEDEDVA
ncbi:unnamed protein product [Moneuplotes crassus]|uniref:Uncharacterized protein n=1 Tax=Euplotes crassus TaxID=5936 RepID=A0AAD2CZG2_EUPCR|nr:unnamed protein product [Moneuplotes crassus]